MPDKLGVAVAEVNDNQINVPPAYSFVDCKNQLMSDFKSIYAKDIESILVFHNGHYTAAFRSLTLAMDTIGKKSQELRNKRAWNSDIISLTLKDGKRSKTFNIARMIRVRPAKECRISEELRQEVARVKEQQKNLDEATCCACGADCNGHEDLPGSMVENCDETTLRKQYEERMTKVKVCTCLTCGTQFTKEIGCNHITCECGTTMCYICRTPKINYGHFCTHTVHIGKPCTTCKCCPLFTNSKQDEERAIEEIRKEAQAERKALGFEGDKDFGAPPVMKKAKF